MEIKNEFPPIFWIIIKHNIIQECFSNSFFLIFTYKDIDFYFFGSENIRGIIFLKVED
jgi:hypothetical protein